MTSTVQSSFRFQRIVLIPSPFHARSRHRFVRITRVPSRSPVIPPASPSAASGGAARPVEVVEDRDAWARRVSSAIARGSREALGELYEAKFDFILAIARERTRRDESFALDCVQDTMLRVAESLEQLDRMESLDSWLRRVVLTAAIDRLRSERARFCRDLGYSAPERDVDADRLRELEFELASLAEEDRSLLSLRFARGLTLQQLGYHLGQAPKAIDSRIRRLVDRLRSRLLPRSDPEARRQSQLRQPTAPPDPPDPPSPPDWTDRPDVADPAAAARPVPLVPTKRPRS